MSRCVESVEERLKLFPQILQLKLLSCEKGVRGSECRPKPRNVAVGLLRRDPPESEPLDADPSSRRVRRFSRRLRTQTAASHCATAVRGPPVHEVWRKPLKYHTKRILNQIQNKSATTFYELVQFRFYKKESLRLTLQHLTHLKEPLDSSFEQIKSLSGFISCSRVFCFTST